jgi:hypothetical protein
LSVGKKSAFLSARSRRDIPDVGDSGKDDSVITNLKRLSWQELASEAGGNVDASNGWTCWVTGLVDISQAGVIDDTERLGRVIVRPGEDIGDMGACRVGIEEVHSERLTGCNAVKRTTRAADAERDDGFWFESDGTH